MGLDNHFLALFDVAFGGFERLELCVFDVAIACAFFVSLDVFVICPPTEGEGGGEIGLEGR